MPHTTTPRNELQFDTSHSVGTRLDQCENTNFRASKHFHEIRAGRVSTETHDAMNWKA